jgi:hypothetical protein
MSFHRGVLYPCHLFSNIKAWKGKSAISIAASAWFEVIVMMLGERLAATSLSEVCLVSNRGWSVFVNTFGEADPYFTGKYFFPGNHQ